MTIKKLLKLFKQTLDSDIEYGEFKGLLDDYLHIIVKVRDETFQIAKREPNKQTLCEDDDWFILMNEKSTLKTDAWLLCSKLNYINEQYKRGRK